MNTGSFLAGCFLGVMIGVLVVLYVGARLEDDEDLD